MRNIHNIDTVSEACARQVLNIDWQYYIERAKGFAIYDAINANKAILCECQDKYNASLQNVPSVKAVCHNDMDCKNVLWHSDDFKIIDLECLGYASPCLELLELALCWAGLDECNVDLELFYAFVKTYFENNAVPDIDWQALYHSNCGRLQWLKYNIKRAILLECDTKETNY